MALSLIMRELVNSESEAGTPAQAPKLRDALAQLFATEKDPIKVIKWKDIYETLERVTDSCEDAANVMQDIIVKMT